MTRDQLEVIIEVLKESKEFIAKEATIIRFKKERPSTVKYLEEEVMPKINEALVITRLIEISITSPYLLNEVTDIYNKCKSVDKTKAIIDLSIRQNCSIQEAIESFEELNRNCIGKILKTCKHIRSICLPSFDTN